MPVIDVRDPAEWLGTAAAGQPFAHQPPTRAKKGLTFRPLATAIRDTLAGWTTLPPERQAKLRAGLPPRRSRKRCSLCARKHVDALAPEH